MSAILKSFINEADYLSGELSNEIKHEYIDGEVYAMSGASGNHNRIAGNCFAKLHTHLINTPCEPFMSDMKVKIDTRYFYPDVMVLCNNQTTDYYSEQPLIIIEVLSKSTRRIDETIKRESYQSIASLQSYILIEQDFVDIEVCNRIDNWRSKHYFLGDEITLASIELTFSVADIYYRVINDDMLALINNQENL
ncbi:MAG: Uma2 family endonuclease [Methylococcaceae bacterium]